MKLNFKSYGENGPIIIILHGLLGSLDNWHRIAKQLSTDHKVYTLDQRNHGRSPHDYVFNYEVMSADILEFFEEHQIEQATLIGHSMGGKTAMHFTLLHPDKVAKLVVVDIAPKEYKRGHDDVFKALFAVNPSVIESRKDAEEQVESFIPDFGVRQFLLKNLTRNDEGNYQWKMNLPVIHEQYDNIRVKLIDGMFHGPVLFIRGGKSPYVQDDDFENAKDTFPNADLEQVEGAGHWVHAEAPNEFIEAVRKFIN